MFRRTLFRFCVILLIPIIYLFQKNNQLRIPEFPSLSLGGSHGLFRADFRVQPLRNNLVAQNEGVSRGAWMRAGK